MNFKTIAPTDPSFLALKKDLSSLSDRFDYDGLGRALRDAPVGGIVQFEYQEGKMSVIAKQLEKRGLSRGTDFTIESGKDGAVHYVFVTRTSEKEPQALPSKARGKKKATAPVAEAAAHTGHAAGHADASKAKGK